MELFLGIDTSCYTTSLAVVDGEGNLFSEARRVLKVPEGGRGLAQSEAVFQHIGSLPDLFTEVFGEFGSYTFKGVAASTCPRSVPGSYMPVFKVSEGYGRSIAALLGIPFLGTSHQEGHLAAGMWSAGGPKDKDFLAVHVSGGTTEILRVAREKSNFGVKLLGGSSDLHAGQFIDRIGVGLGLPFPAGPHLEKLARESSQELSIPSSVRGFNVSFSGPEAQALRLIQWNQPAADIARAVEQCVANSLEKIIKLGILDTQLTSVLIVGGVSANLNIRERLRRRLEHKAVGARLYFASPELSSDNAVGTALLAKTGVLNNEIVD